MSEIVTKIIMRQGEAADLPGAPISRDPSTLTAPLDPAEIGFATDENRLFVGPDLTGTLMNRDRTTYPYQNIEIIGENSTTAFADLHAPKMREDHEGFYSASLGGPTTSFVDMVNRTGQKYVMGTTARAVLLTYSITGADGRTLRQGRLSVAFLPTLDQVDRYEAMRVPEETIADANPTGQDTKVFTANSGVETMSLMAMEATKPSLGSDAVVLDEQSLYQPTRAQYTAGASFGSIRLRFVLVNGRYVLRYFSDLSENLLVRFRVTRLS